AWQEVDASLLPPSLIPLSVAERACGRRGAWLTPVVRSLFRAPAMDDERPRRQDDDAQRTKGPWPGESTGRQTQRPRDAFQTVAAIDLFPAAVVQVLIGNQLHYRIGSDIRQYHHAEIRIVIRQIVRQLEIQTRACPQAGEDVRQFRVFFDERKTGAELRVQTEPME